MKTIQIALLALALLMQSCEYSKTANDPKPQEISTSDWMGQIYKEHASIPLTSIAIPGTHDAITNEIKSTSDYSLLPVGEWSKEAKDAVGKEGIYQFSRNQSNNALQQLEDGIRYFDLRIQSYKGTFYSFHHLVSNPMEAVFDDIASFLSKHPKEVLIMDMQALCFNEDHEYNQLLDLIVEKLGRYIASPQEFKVNSPLSLFWEKGKNIVLLADYKYNGAHQEEYVFDRPKHILNHWPNAYDPSIIEPVLIDSIAQRPMNKLYVTQSIQSPHNETLLNAANGGPIGIIGMVEEKGSLNHRFPVWFAEVLQSAQQHEKKVNIFIFDQYQRFPVIIKRFMEVNKAYSKEVD